MFRYVSFKQATSRRRLPSSLPPPMVTRASRGVRWRELDGPRWAADLDIRCSCCGLISLASFLDILFQVCGRERRSVGIVHTFAVTPGGRSLGTYETLRRRRGITSGQAHRLPFPGGGGQKQLFNIEYQSTRTVTLLSDDYNCDFVIFSQKATIVQ